MNLKSLLQEFYGVIKAQNNSYKRTYNTPLFNVTQLDNLQTAADNTSILTKEAGYSSVLSSLVVHVPNKPRDTANPDGVKMIDVRLEVEIDLSQIDNKKIIDPIKKLGFAVTVSSKNPIAFQSWHLDKQGEPKPGAKPDAHIHPEYHVSFGGGNITKARRQELDEDIFDQNVEIDFGQTLFIGTPRFMHPPMDIILGIDFILCHYVAKEYAEYFTGNPKYQRIVQTMKDALWKPYAYAFANNFCKELTADNQPLNLDSKFCESVIGKH
jgi:hypothetical protein